MKERLKATHFIEQYSVKYRPNSYVHTTPNRISELHYYLDLTNRSMFLKSIAIFKIKFKNK